MFFVDSYYLFVKATSGANTLVGDLVVTCAKSRLQRYNHLDHWPFCMFFIDHHSLFLKATSGANTLVGDLVVTCIKAGYNVMCWHTCQHDQMKTEGQRPVFTEGNHLDHWPLLRLNWIFTNKFFYKTYFLDYEILENRIFKVSFSMRWLQP